MGKKHLLMAAAAGAMMLGMSSAEAADVEPVADPATWYVSLFGGASFLEDVDTDYDYDGDDDRLEANTNVGFIVGGAIGTHLTEDLRVEFEVAYSENSIDDIRYSGPMEGFTEDGRGSYQNLTFMGNLWYDIPLSDTIAPYVGGGAGVAIIDGRAVMVFDSGGVTDYDSTEVAFAFQLGGGLRFAFFENVTLDVGYRLRGVEGVKFNGSEWPADPTYKADTILSHNLIGGVSLGF